MTGDAPTAGPDWGEPATSESLDGTPVAHVLEGGLLTTVQDGGRFGYQASGVPVCGAMDYYAMRSANLLLGNTANAAVLEITLTGPQLQFVEDVVVAVAGADLGLWVQWPGGQQWEMPCDLAIFLRRGSILGFGARRNGCRAYLAIVGGFRVPTVLGSASTCLAEGFGGHEGRPLQPGDWLFGSALGQADHLRAGHRWLEQGRPRYSAHPTVCAMPGPHWEQFTEEAQAAFFSAAWEVKATSNRQGIRLQGPALQRRQPVEVISCGVTMGTVQVPADGQPIVLGADRQTVGGYAQIATVLDADMPLIAQLAPGDRVSFQMAK